MPLFKATIDILLDAEDEGQAEDALSEALRPLLREFSTPESCWIDWRYAELQSTPTPHDGAGFEYNVRPLLVNQKEDLDPVKTRWPYGVGPIGGPKRPRETSKREKEKARTTARKRARASQGFDSRKED